MERLAEPLTSHQAAGAAFIARPQSDPAALLKQCADPDRLTPREALDLLYTLRQALNDDDKPQSSAARHASWLSPCFFIARLNPDNTLVEAAISPARAIQQAP